MKTSFLITSSWDDGHVLDARLASLLEKYGWTGTFYVTKNTENRLTEDEIRDVGLRHEIGAHTLNHPDLTKLAPEELVSEVQGSKVWLESFLGKEVSMFCYPKGRYNQETIEAVRGAGFAGARTVESFSYASPVNPFRMSATLQVYPFPFRMNDAKHINLRQPLQPFLQKHGALKRIGIPYNKFFSWQSLARAVFDVSYKKGKVFHLWGHSWELDRYGMWDELESFLSYVQNTATNARFVSNREVLSV